MTGMFRDRDSAERAWGSLSGRGYGSDDVSLLMSDETRKRHFGEHAPDTALGDKAAEGAGAGGGGVAGGLLGALIGAGIPEDRAKYYDAGIREGGIVMGVHPRSAEDADYFEREWANYRGEQIYRPEYYRNRDAA